MNTSFPLHPLTSLPSISTEGRCSHRLLRREQWDGEEILFTNPFSYTPHPLCLQAAEEVRRMIAECKEWQEEVSKGKMFGVLVVQDKAGEVGFLAAYSGQMGGRSDWDGFVPAVFDYLQPDGYFKQEEARISELNHRITLLSKAPEYRLAQQQLEQCRQEANEAIARHKERMQAAKVVRDHERAEGDIDELREEELLNESRWMKAELRRLKQHFQQRQQKIEAQIKVTDDEIVLLKEDRKRRSDALQRWLFAHFEMRNARGESKNLLEIFASATHQLPPAGTGECAAPKLLQYAFTHDLKPLCMAEFWVGESPKTEIRHEGHFYPACQGKCKPTLHFMLQGMEVMPLDLQQCEVQELEVVYEDEYLLVVNKPAGMLSVPGKEAQLSVYDLMRQKYPHTDSPLIVHRLDMATSGLLAIAKTKECHQLLQAAFAHRKIKKRYIAKLDGVLPADKEEGTIDVPLTPDYHDRPRQKVDWQEGKKAVTHYRVIERQEQYTWVALEPHTGRTHQLRVHCASPHGLNTPIVGDLLYGKAADRLYLHAEQLQFIHPITHQQLNIYKHWEE